MPAASWLCTACGYVHHGERPPETCPVCGAGADAFERQAAAAPPPAARVAKRWRCVVCGYVHEGDAPPELCPACGAGADQFEPAPGPAAAPAAAGAGRAARFVVVGAGIAGVGAAEALRRARPDASVVLLSGEEELPYYRINLTRWLAGEVAEADLPLHPREWYAGHGIELRLGATVASFDPKRRTVEVPGSKPVSYDALVLACGAHAFRPPFEGAEGDGVFALRTVADARTILDRVGRGGAVVVVGGGVLGLETAAALARRGAAVEVLEGHDWLMPRQLTPAAGRRLAARIGSLGVRVRHRAATRRIRTGARLAVELEDGTVLPAGTVVLATGVRPHTHLARRAGLAVGRGASVDDHLRTSAPDVYAAGDVAEHRGVAYGLWAPALFQGQIAARNAAGQPTEFGGMPPATVVKVLGTPLLSVGAVRAEDAGTTMIEEDAEARYVALFVRDGRLAGAVVMGDESAAGAVRAAVEAGRDVSGLLGARPTADGLLAVLAGR